MRQDARLAPRPGGRIMVHKSAPDEDQQTRGHRGRFDGRHWWIAPLAWGVISLTAGVRLANAADAISKSWIEQSNRYTRQLFDIQLEHSPEQGSTEGVARFDVEISDPRLADELAQQRELENVLNALKTDSAQVSDKNVQQDLDILQRAFDLQFRTDDFARQHLVTAFNPSESVFQGIHALLDNQVPANRRLAALARLRKYTGLEPGF